MRTPLSRRTTKLSGDFVEGPLGDMAPGYLRQFAFR